MDYVVRGVAYFFLLIATTGQSPDLDMPLPVVEPAMDNQRLGEILTRIDPNVAGRPGLWTIEFEGLGATIVTDENADRMRVVIPVAEVDELEREHLLRLMQANYESALDARYAIAQGYVWSAFIHPLSSLREADLVSAIAQTYNAAFTYGTSFSSGVFNFNGGDNSDAFDAIIEKGLKS